MTEKPAKNARLVAILVALFVVFLWATSWVLIKIGLEDIPALTFAGLRYALGFVCLLPVFLLRGGLAQLRAITRRGWLRLALLGVLFYALTQGAIFAALAFLPAVTVNLLWSFSSVAVALLGIRFLDEHLTGFQWLGVALAVLGAVVFFFPAAFPENFLVGVSIALVGVLANAGASIFGREINREGSLNPLTVTVTSMGIGSALLLATGIGFQGLPALGLQQWGIIAWLAVVNTALAFTLWNFTLRTLYATESSVINGTMLIWIPILAVVFLGEQVTLKELAGLAAAGLGTLIVQLRYPGAVRRILAGRLPEA